KSVVEGESVDLGGRPSMKKKLIVEQYSWLQCARIVREICARHCFQSGNFDRVMSLIDKYEKKNNRYRFGGLQENLRRAVVSGKAGGFFTMLSKAGHYMEMSGIRLAEVFNQPFNEADLAGIGPEYVAAIMQDVMRDAHYLLEPADEASAFLKKKSRQGKIRRDCLPICSARISSSPAGSKNMTA
ncbi:MAG: hypothetical protein M1418_07415, partial [Deltaproteobacteria bacterium]|nr:hypothetical protein [Deltaproteobacteria bacterium]